MEKSGLTYNNSSFFLLLFVLIFFVEQEFECRAINVISFGVLASEFNGKSKNINLFARERHYFLAKKPKGFLLGIVMNFLA